MKRSILLLFVLITSLLISDKATAQQCNANFTFTQDSGLVNFTNTSSAGATGFYGFWNFGDGNYDSAVNPTHQYTSTGTFNVMLYISANDSSCWDSIIIPVTITSVSYSYTCNSYFTKDTIGNDPLHLQFTNGSTSSGGSLSYAWNFGDGNTSTLMNPDHIYQNAGTYNVCLTVSNTTTGCTDTYCQSYSVQNNCFAAYSFTNPQAGTYNFTNHSTGSNLVYNWNFGDGNTSNAMNPTHVYSASGYYYITLTVYSSTDSTCNSQYVGAVSVNLNPPACNADFYMYQDSLDPYHYYIINTSSGSGLNYAWNFGDGTIDSTAYPTHTYQDSIPYLICLTVFTGNCQDTHCDTLFPGRSSGNITVTVLPAPVGVEEAKANSFSVYPNPAQSVMNVKISEEFTGTLNVYDISGREVLTQPVSGTHGKLITTDISMLSNGYYIVRLSGNGGEYAPKKIMKN